MAFDQNGTTDNNSIRTSTRSRRQATIRRVPSSLVDLDNPDDGELFETGDASDFAGEARSKYNFENKKAARINYRRS